jgi:cytochrome c
MKSIAYLAAIAIQIAGLTALATDLPVEKQALAAASLGDPARGQRLYQSRCGACHSLDSNRVGPMHRGIFGRQAGGVAAYAYSRALQESTVVWSDETLDSWLQDPRSFIAGQRMNVRVKKPQDRRDIISYLKQESEG